MPQAINILILPQSLECGSHCVCTGKELVCFIGAFNESNGIDYFKGRSCSMTVVTEVEAGHWAVVPEVGMVVLISVGGLCPGQSVMFQPQEYSSCLRHKWQSLL